MVQLQFLLVEERLQVARNQITILIILGLLKKKLVFCGAGT